MATITWQDIRDVLERCLHSEIAANRIAAAEMTKREDDLLLLAGDSEIAVLDEVVMNEYCTVKVLRKAYETLRAAHQSAVDETYSAAMRESITGEYD
jgi:hypothetical protein